MIVSELSPAEYARTAQCPFTVFDSVEFCAINAHKVEAVKHLVFSDQRLRFGLIAGIRDGVLKAPFSAPYACFSEISRNNKIASYSSLAASLADYAKGMGLKKIRITLPPTVYNEVHIAKLYNSFYTAGFRIAGCDLNFQYDLAQFDAQYEMRIDPKARQKLRAAIKNGLTFEKTEDVEAAYKIIHANRAAKNYPLWMTLENVRDTARVVPADFFLARDDAAMPLASAMVYHVTHDKAQVIYWGNLPETDALKPMNFLAYRIFAHYKGAGMRLIDTGPSTEFSVPNLGLCDFKQGLGCDVSTKFTFELDV